MDRPQLTIPPAADVLGTIGTGASFGLFLQTFANNTGSYTLLSCWCVQIIPQIWHNYRQKSTEGLPGSMLILWSICGVPFGVYAIVQNFSFALQFQPQAFAALTLISWGQTLYYHNKWKAWTATVATILLATSFGVMEVILIFTLQGPYDRGVKWPMMLMAISATLIQIAGLIPPYFELAKRNGRVIGIDFWFLLIDYAGAFFSLMALVAQQWFDSLGGSLYIACMLLETGIFASQAIWMWRVRHVRREAKNAGKTYDEYVSDNPSKKIPRSESSETIVDVEACHESQSEETVTEKANTTSKEIQNIASEANNTAEEAPAYSHGLIQKWKRLVLRPVHDLHP